MDSCLFCKIVAGEIPAQKIYEDDDFLAFLDIKPVNLGHSLIVPKKHCRNLLDMPGEILAKAGPLIKKIAQAIKDGVGANGINIGWNNEGAAGQLVFHAHIHVIPRFENDGFVHWAGIEIPTPELTITAEKIKSQLN